MMVDDRSLRPLGIGIAWPIYIEMRKESKPTSPSLPRLPFISASGHRHSHGFIQKK